MENLSLFNDYKWVSYVTEAASATAPCRSESNEQVSSNQSCIYSLARPILALAIAPQAAGSMIPVLEDTINLPANAER